MVRIVRAREYIDRGRAVARAERCHDEIPATRKPHDGVAESDEWKILRSLGFSDTP